MDARGSPAAGTAVRVHVAEGHVLRGSPSPKVLDVATRTTIRPTPSHTGQERRLRLQSVRPVTTSDAPSSISPTATTPRSDVEHVVAPISQATPKRTTKDAGDGRGVPTMAYRRQRRALRRFRGPVPGPPTRRGAPGGPDRYWGLGPPRVGVGAANRAPAAPAGRRSGEATAARRRRRGRGRNGGPARSKGPSDRSSHATYVSRRPDDGGVAARAGPTGANAAAGLVGDPSDPVTDGSPGRYRPWTGPGRLPRGSPGPSERASAPIVFCYFPELVVPGHTDQATAPGPARHQPEGGTCSPSEG